MNRLFTIIFAFCFCNSFAQITFEKKWGGYGYQDGMSVCKTSDGGFTVAGSGTRGTVATLDIVLMKVDSVGDSLWTKVYGDTTANDFPSAITETYDGGFLISATTYSRSYQAPNFSDWWILRTDANGDTMWTKTITNYGNDRAWYISENDDHSFLCAGWIRVNPGYARATLMKFSETGDSLWSAQISGGANTYGEFCGQLDNGNYILAGAGYSGTFYGMVSEFDANGVFIDIHSYDKTGTAEVVNTIDHLPQGGYLISAKTGTINGFDIWVIRTTEQWDTMWTKTFNDPIYLTDIEARFAFCAVADSGCIFGGYDYGATDMQAVIYRIDSSGTLEWTRTFGGVGDDRADALLCLDDGGFLFSGQTGLVSNSSADMYIVRTDGNGNVMGPTDVRDLPDEGEFRIAYDPRNKRVTWSGSLSVIQEIRIFSVDGKTVSVISKPSSEGYFSTESLSQGIYFFRIVTDQNQFARKIILD